MAKILIVLLVALICEAGGVVLLKGGLDEVCKGKDVTLTNFLPVVLKAFTNVKVWLGFLGEALFFLGLLYMMSQRDISFVWPLTSLSFVMTTLAAVFYLREPVSGTRWAGVALIMLGAGLITWSEKVKEIKAKESAAAVEQVQAHTPRG